MAKIKPKSNGARYMLNLTPEERTTVKVAASKRGISMRQYIREALHQRLVADGEIEENEE